MRWAMLAMNVSVAAPEVHCLEGRIFRMADGRALLGLFSDDFLGMPLPRAGIIRWRQRSRTFGVFVACSPVFGRLGRLTSLSTGMTVTVPAVIDCFLLPSGHAPFV